MNNLDFTQIFAKQGFWSKVSPNSDTVLSTKVRLIRNIYNIPFPHRQERIHVNFIESVAGKFIKESVYKDLELLELDSVDENNKRFLRERGIISQNMETSRNAFVILNLNEEFNILVNDGNHFKIQVIKPGFQLTEACRLGDRVDDELNRFAVYGFSEDIGYITSNASTDVSFKVSIMLHLPVLSFTRRIVEAQDIVKLNRLNIRGLKEDGIKTYGGIFILSNGILPGIEETKIIAIIEKTIHKIIQLESEARENYLSEHVSRLEDRVGRSLGLLKYARRIGYVESIDYLSDVRLGVILSIIKNIEIQKINDLMMNMQWSHLQKSAKRSFRDTSEGDIFRASYLRDQLEWSTING